MNAPVSVPQYSAQERRTRILAIVGASSGNLVEWFDFCVSIMCGVALVVCLLLPDLRKVSYLNDED